MTSLPQLPSGPHLPGSIDSLYGLQDGSVGWLVFNNPARRNAVSRAMWEAMPLVIDAIEAAPDIKVVVVTGAGDKAFVSGADISEFEKQRSTAEANADFRKISGIAGARLIECTKPTIAMIRGACIGGGLATALNCDMRVAAETARFGIPAARLGIGYPFAGVQRLVSLVGPDRAKSILFTARHFTAQEAYDIGLVTEVVADAELETRVRELASMISANAPLSIRASKLAVNAAVRDPDQRDIAAVDAAVAAAMGSEDFREGSRAFMEKRVPNFTGS